jgi:hypothetical protein
MQEAGIEFGPGEEAAHVVPEKIGNRNFETQSSINQARDVLKEHDLLNDAENGFKTDSSNHLGTHQNVFLKTLGKLLSDANEAGWKAGGKAGGKARVIQVLREIKGRLTG